MALKFPPKDPNDIVDEMFDWSEFLVDGETITDAEVTVAPTGELAVSGVLANADNVVFHVSGGETGSTYVITCQIETSNGNTVNRKASISVKDL